MDERQTIRADQAIIEQLLQGAVDLHCHSGPSVMDRRIDHIEVMRDAAAVGMRALLIKDHYYSAAPVTALLNRHFADTGVQLLSGVPLNNATGGFNRYAVDHGIKLGARLVWMPTFSARNHLDHHRKDKDFHQKFPSTKERMLAPEPLTVLEDSGVLKDEVKFIVDLIAEADLVLSGGHLHAREIFKLFEYAKAAGVKRLLVNHPSYVVDATLAEMTEFARMGAYLEHSMCMFIPGSKFCFYEPDELDSMIRAVGVEKTILGSDLGQTGNPTPVEGFRHVIGTCLELGYSPEEIRSMVSTNACALVGIEPRAG
jgi:hypothetical protein